MVTASRSFCAALAVGCYLGFGVANLATAADTLPKGSPFLPAGGPGLAVTPSETIEFAAVRTIGKQTDINLYDTQVKRSHWIPLGGTVDGMTVLNYDSRREQVVAKIAGVEKVLALRKTKGVANGPAPIVVAAPAESFATPVGTSVQRFQLPQPAVAGDATSPATSAVATESVAAPAQPAATPPAPAQPLSVARQEEEARMLVSDLLEIGMAQRKAYEEKQRQAADPNAAPAATPPAPPASPAPGVPPTSG